MSVEAVILDVDGTLVLLPINWDHVMRIIAEEKCSAQTFLGFVAKCFGTESFWRVHEFVKRLELEAVEKMVVLDNSPEVMKRLCRSYRVALVTMQSMEAAKAVVSKLGLDNCVEVVISREYARNRVEQVAKAIKLLGVEPSKTLFIGDKVLDGFAAYANGVRGVVIMRGNICTKVSDTDLIDEDLDALGVVVVRSLWEAIEVAERFGLIRL